MNRELHRRDCHPTAGSDEAVLALITATITESILRREDASLLAGT